MRHCHRAGFNRFLIPHPPLANWLLRMNLSDQARLELTFAHEFAHFETLPALLLYMPVMAVLISLFRPIDFMAMTVIFISGQALWEMLSEAAVIHKDFERYRRFYRQTGTFPRIVFWSLCTIILSGGWAIRYF